MCGDSWRTDYECDAICFGYSQPKPLFGTQIYFAFVSILFILYPFDTVTTPHMHIYLIYLVPHLEGSPTIWYICVVTYTYVYLIEYPSS
jgi:hypothetical protein